jgi:putative multiple sugar transport system permease protein
VGGAAVSGGVGKVSGSILGALVMASLTNGMNLMGVDISIQYIVRALVLVFAVIFDVQTRKNVQTR